MEESIVKLQNRIAKNELEDEVDLCNYVQLASRMKALGDSSAFDMLPLVFKKSWYIETADIALDDCCRELMWYFEQPLLDEEMVCMLIQAQDMKLFYEYSKDKNWYPKETHEWFVELFVAADKVQLNDVVRSDLKLWLDTYPIPEEYRLFDVSE